MYQKTVNKVSKMPGIKGLLVISDNFVDQLKDGLDTFGQRNQSESFKHFQNGRRHAAQKRKGRSEI